MRKNLRNFLLASLLILGPVALILGVAQVSSGALAEATVDVEGRQVRFELQPYGDGVSARVSFDRDWIHYRRCVEKSVPRATLQAARAAHFEYDAQTQRARFSMKTGTVFFTRRGEGEWSILPVVSGLDG